jgi:hypothetical protein
LVSASGTRVSDSASRPVRTAAIGRWLPPAAGTDGVRGIVYFVGAGAGFACLVLATCAGIGVLAILTGSGRGQGTEPDVATPTV